MKRGRVRITVVATFMVALFTAPAVMAQTQKTLTAQGQEVEGVGVDVVVGGAGLTSGAGAIAEDVQGGVVEVDGEEAELGEEAGAFGAGELAVLGALDAGCLCRAYVGTPETSGSTLN